MTPSHAAYGLFRRLKAHRNWLRWLPDDAERVLICELIRCGWIVGDKLREPVAAKETNPQHSLTIEAWCISFQEHFKFKYNFQPRDARAVAELLKLGMSPHEVIALAERAWAAAMDRKRFFFCGHASTLVGLHLKLNEIRSELGAVQRNGSSEQLKARVL